MQENESEIVDDGPNELVSIKDMAEMSQDPNFKMQFLRSIEEEYNPDLRKDHRPTEASRMRVRFYKIAGTDDKNIAKALGLSLIKFKKIYAYEIAMGVQDLNALVTGKLIEKINQGESAAIFFYLRCKAKFTPSTEQLVEHKISISRPKEDIESELLELGVPSESLKKLLEGE